MAADALHVVRGRDRDPGADRQLDLNPVDHDATAEPAANPIGEIDRRVLINVAVAQHDEFVSADAGDNIGGAGGLCNSMRHLCQQCVANLVTDRVVDILQSIDIHEQDGNVVARISDALERISGCSQQQESVG